MGDKGFSSYLCWDPIEISLWYREDRKKTLWSMSHRKLDVEGVTDPWEVLSVMYWFFL